LKNIHAEIRGGIFMASEAGSQLELTIDKFIFRFPKDLKYSQAGLWIRQEETRLRLGLSDFVQQRSGDIAFANLFPPGTKLEAGDEVAGIETVKVNVSLPSPVTGIVLEANAAVQKFPELINLEPYAGGWLVIMQIEDIESQLGRLLTAEDYFALVKEQAVTELNG